MSGPKHSNFRLMQAQRKRLEEERKRKLEEQKRIEEERMRQSLDQDISALLLQLREYKSGVGQYEKELVDEAVILLSESPAFKQFNRRRETMLSKMKELPFNYGERTLESMKVYRHQINSLLREIEKEITYLQEDLGQLKKELRLKKTFQAEQEFLSQVKDMKLAKRKQISFDRSPDDLRSREECDFLLQEFHRELTPYLDNPFCDKKEELQAFYGGLVSITRLESVDDHYKTEQIKQRIQAFWSTKKIYDSDIDTNQRHNGEYEHLLLHYQTLCSMLGIPCKPEYFSVSTPALANWLVLLKQETDDLEQSLERKEEMNYIANCVHEVIESLGHELIATDYMKTKMRQVEHQIFEIDNNHVVNVFTSDNGSVLFEVTGVSEERREATSLEKLKIKESMGAFCGQYEEIKRRLRERGVELINEDLKQADEKYVRIMNISSKKKVTRKNRADRQRIIQLRKEQQS